MRFGPCLCSAALDNTLERFLREEGKDLVEKHNGKMRMDKFQARYEDYCTPRLIEEVSLPPLLLSVFCLVRARNLECVHVSPVITMCSS